MKKFLKILLCAGIFLHSSTHIIFAESLRINLDDAIDLALKNNRTIEQSADDREAARWYLSSARRSFGPTLTWSSTSQRIGGRYYENYRVRRELFQTTPEYLRRYYSLTNNLSDYPKYEAENYNAINFSFPLYSGGRLAV